MQRFTALGSQDPLSSWLCNHKVNVDLERKGICNLDLCLGPPYYPMSALQPFVFVCTKLPLSFELHV